MISFPGPVSSPSTTTSVASTMRRSVFLEKISHHGTSSPSITKSIGSSSPTGSRRHHSTSLSNFIAFFPNAFLPNSTTAHSPKKPAIQPIVPPNKPCHQLPGKLASEASCGQTAQAMSPTTDPAHVRLVGMMRYSASIHVMAASSAMRTQRKTATCGGNIHQTSPKSTAVTISTAM